MFQFIYGNNEVALGNRLSGSGVASCCTTKNPQKQAQ